MIYSFKRWRRNFNSIVANTVSGIGLFWLFVEIASYSTNGSIDQYLKSITVFSVAAILILFISLLLNKPKSVLSSRIRNKDSIIEVRIGDAFSNAGALIVPFNDYFDVSLGGNVKKAKSVQNRLISEYYSGKEGHLKADIESQIDLQRTPFPIGKTLEVEQKEKVFYLLVTSKKGDNNRVTSSIDDFLLSLASVWQFIALESGRNAVITIPLLGTKHGRITNITKSTAIKEIIDSFIEASKHLNVADKLIISIYPSDFEKSDIDLDDIDEFLVYACRHYKLTEFSDKPEGQIEASTVKHIERS